MSETDAGPLIPRRRLGAAFRALRDARRETLQQTARSVMFSPSKLSRIENGQAGEPHPRDVRDLIAHFAPGEAETARLESLAEAGRVPGWWQVPPYSMPSRLDTFISYESAAARMESYVPAVVPWILQTPAYADAALRALAPHLAPAEREHQVEIRMERQRALRARANSPTLLFVIPEAVLHRRVGTRDEMRTQLTAMLDSYDDPAIDLHVIPFSAGIYEALEVTSLTVFLFADDADADVVALERVGFTQFLERPDDVAKYRNVVSGLEAHRLDRSRSRAFIARVRDQE